MASVPEGEDYGGITDRHIMAPRDLFLKAIDGRLVMCDVATWSPRFTAAGVFNLESMLSVIFSHMNIPIARFPRNMFSVRVDGDKTRWSQGVKNNEITPKFGLKIKYENELAATEKTCGLSGIQVLDEMDKALHTLHGT